MAPAPGTPPSRFGPAIAEQTEPMLARIDNLQQLEDFGDQLLLSQDGAVWLGVVRKAGSDEDQ